MSKYEPRFLTTFGRYGSSGDIQGFSQRSKPKLWTSDQEILVHQYQDVMNSNDALFNWLHGKLKSVRSALILFGIIQI